MGGLAIERSAATVFWAGTSAIGPRRRSALSIALWALWSVLAPKNAMPAAKRGSCGLFLRAQPRRRRDDRASCWALHPASSGTRGTPARITLRPAGMGRARIGHFVSFAHPFFILVGYMMEANGMVRAPESSCCSAAWGRLRRGGLNVAWCWEGHGFLFSGISARKMGERRRGRVGASSPARAPRNAEPGPNAVALLAPSGGDGRDHPALHQPSSSGLSGPTSRFGQGGSFGRRAHPRPADGAGG